MGVYLADLKSYIGNLHEASSRSLFFRRYRVVEFQGKECLIGVEYIRKERTVEYDSPALLFAFVKLVQPPLPEAFLSDDKEPMRKAIPKKGIIRFCKKFGMPYTVVRPMKSLPVIEDTLHDIAEPKGILELDMFRYRLAWLYTYFRVWYALYSGEDEETLKDFAARYQSFYPEEGSIKAIAKAALADAVSLGMDRIRIMSRYNKEKDSFTINVRGGSLLDIAYFHLANLLTMDNHYIKQHLKSCNDPRCGRLFWSLHGHQKYCVFCDRRTAYKQRKGGG